MSMRYQAGIVLPGYNALKVANAPTIGTATVASGTSVSVAFTAPACVGGGAISSYTVFACCGVKTASGASSPVVVTGLTSGSSYTFKAVAVNAYGPSYPSASSNSATTWTVPGAPTIGTATAGSSSASVAFTAPASTGGTAITGYTATSSPGGFTGTGASSPVTVSGLTNGTAYTFTVTATNSVGTGPASAASNSVTPFIPVGQQAYTAVGTYSFVVPCGVTSVAAVVVGGGGYGYYEVGQTSSFGAYVQAYGGTPSLSGGGLGGGGTTIGGCVGGGDGGRSGTSANNLNGGGGAGGYTGDGGRGGNYNGTYVSGSPGVSSTGGGGGGGGGAYYDGCYSTGGGGAGGVGLLGLGANGSGGGGNGGAGSGGSGGCNGETCGNVLGGRYGGGSNGAGGGGLRYRNNISVTPGSSITVTVGRAGSGSTCYGGRGAVRIIWPGTTRSFPSTCTGNL